jgi:NADPH:quinone reductase-like Zn-dependent oxidoreductase
MSAKAVVFSGVRGKPEEVLSLQDVPKPKPGPGQLLVKVKLAPVHPSVLAGM